MIVGHRRWAWMWWHYIQSVPTWKAPSYLILRWKPTFQRSCRAESWQLLVAYLSLLALSQQFRTSSRFLTINSLFSFFVVNFLWCLYAANDGGWSSVFERKLEQAARYRDGAVNCQLIRQWLARSIDTRAHRRPSRQSAATLERSLA